MKAAMLVIFVAICFIISVDCLSVPDAIRQGVKEVDEDIKKLKNVTSEFDHDNVTTTIETKTTHKTQKSNTTTFKPTTTSSSKPVIVVQQDKPNFGQSVIHVIESIPGVQLAKSYVGALFG
uniref:Uncharacterized protein n=1 Tax=Panagrolaimus sp. ES5 TaxID=591445 RepID=A0AC34FAR6_9BILA